MIPSCGFSQCYNDYYFFIRELAKDFGRVLDCIGENSEICILFSVPTTKEDKRIDKRGKEIKPKIISYKSKFIDSTSFMASSLKRFVNNLGEGT